MKTGGAAPWLDPNGKPSTTSEAKCKVSSEALSLTEQRLQQALQQGTEAQRVKQRVVVRGGPWWAVVSRVG